MIRYDGPRRYDAYQRAAWLKARRAYPGAVWVRGAGWQGPGAREMAALVREIDDE